MDTFDKQCYRDRYNNRLMVYGYDSRSLGWGGGKERQNLRFKILTEIGIDPQSSILDVGCGFCDLYGYLKSSGWKGQYLGVDINSSLLDFGRKIYPDVIAKEIDILATDIPQKFDWVFSSGIFNAKLYKTDNIGHISAMLEKMYSLCLKGVASDFMSTFVDFQHPDAFHADPCDIIKIVKTFCRPLSIRMDYLPYEYMVYIYKK